MATLKIEIPSDISSSLRFPPGEREKEVKRELAVALYKRGALSLGKARQLANMSRWEFHELLGERNVSRHYSEENLEEDQEYVRRNS